MSLVTERQNIEEYFQDNWVTGSPASPRTPVEYEDVKIEPPANTLWLQFNILNGQGAQMSVGTPGSNIVRNSGVLAIRVNVPSMQGSAPFRAVADDIQTLFRNTTIGNVRFTIPYVSGGFTTMGAYSTWTIMCPFTRDEFNG